MKCWVLLEMAKSWGAYRSLEMSLESLWWKFFWAVWCINGVQFKSKSAPVKSIWLILMKRLGFDPHSFEFLYPIWVGQDFSRSGLQRFLSRRNGNTLISSADARGVWGVKVSACFLETPGLPKWPDHRWQRTANRKTQMFFRPFVTAKTIYGSVKVVHL